MSESEATIPRLENGEAPQEPPKPQWTEEQLSTARGIVQGLVKKPLMLQLITTLLFARRLYVLTRVELRASLEHLLKETPEMREICEESLVQAMDLESRKPFDSDDMPAALRDIVLPCIVNINSLRREDQKEEKKRSLDELEKRRREGGVSIVLHPNVDNPAVARGTVIIAIGEHKLLSEFLLRQSSKSLSDGLQVTWLASGVEDVNRDCYLVPPQVWVNIARSREHIEKLLLGVRKSVNRPMDVLLIGDFMRCRQEELPLLPSTKAASIMRIVLQWARKAGAVVVGAVPLIDESECVSYSKLSEHATVVRVVRGENDIRLEPLEVSCPSRQS